MKIGRLIVYLLFMGVLFSFLGNCATDKTAYVATADEEIYGIWINDKQQYPQKLIMFPDMTWEYYTHTYDISPKRRGTFELYKKWKDDQGNIWYHNYVTFEGYSGNKQYELELDRIYRDGKIWVWEYGYKAVISFEPDGFPEKIDPVSGCYYIFYRSAE